MLAMAMAASAAHPSGLFENIAIGIVPIRLWRTIAIASQNSRMAATPKSEAASTIPVRGRTNAKSVAISEATKDASAINRFNVSANQATAALPRAGCLGSIGWEGSFSYDLTKFYPSTWVW